MAPPPVDDDPVTAEYTVLLTPALAEQVFLLQYPNRSRAKPYNARLGSTPQNVRIKPLSRHLEVDISLSTARHFNKFQGLKWGDALATGKEMQNREATYGPAAGFSAGIKSRALAGRGGGGAGLKDQADRNNELMNRLAGFKEAEREEKVLKVQTLGGQIVRHDLSAEEGGEQGGPVYFVGSFRGSELHLTKVTGTVQMRPQFHHLDAEEQRNRIAASRATDPGAGLGGPIAPVADPRAVLQKVKLGEESEKDKLQNLARQQLQQAEAEEWIKLDYVDEDEEEAFEVFREKLFVKDVDGAVALKSAVGVEDFLDAVGRGGTLVRRRKKKKTMKPEVEAESGDDMDLVPEGGAV